MPRPFEDVAYIFDVDGTLTPSRDKINRDFAQKFMGFQMNHLTYLVTGSDYEKTLDQMGFQSIFLAERTFHCCGNEVRQQGKVIHRNDWTPSTELIEYLQYLLTQSKFPIESRTANFIEYRNGSINFSVLGRAATKEQRQIYIAYDKEKEDRHRLVEHIRNDFPEVTVQIGGETGLDIMPLGFDKSQILPYVLRPYMYSDTITSSPIKSIVFFGDAIFPFGNDYSLATVLGKNKKNKVFSVRGWKDVDALLFPGDYP